MKYGHLVLLQNMKHGERHSDFFFFMTGNAVLIMTKKVNHHEPTKLYKISAYFNLLKITIEDLTEQGLQSQM